MDKKNRNLSVAEYFLIIQKEYLIAEFRKKIYFSKNDKIYYQRVMDGKKNKINDIAKRNRLDSIFNNSENLAELAIETGFFDQSHFIRYFKKIVGLTPSDYKKSFKIVSHTF